MVTVRAANSKGRIEEIPLDAVPDLLRNGETPVWLDFDSPSQSEVEFLRTHLRIHDLTMEDVVNQNQRPKIESFEDYVYLAIHYLKRNERLEIEPCELDLLLGKNWLVSVHYEPVPGLLQNSHLHERLSIALPRGADFLLYTIVDLIVDSHFPLLDEIDDEIDSLQEKLLGKAEREDMNRLLILKRSLVHIRRAVGPQREVFNELTRRDFGFIRSEYALYFRDVYDHLIRITEEIDSLRDLLAGALEIHLTTISNDLNITMKRLTAWATIFVVITAIAGIYGMNFEHMPELKWRYGYLAVMVLMAVISGALYVYFKKRDYL